MSMEMIAFVHSEKLPNRQQWQDAIDAHKVPLTLDPELDLATDSGFSPCQLRGELSGFELFVEKVGCFSYDLQRLNIAGRDIAIVFRWGSYLAEAACVMGATLALSSSCDAVIYYSDDDQILSQKELEDDLVQFLQELDQPK